MWKSYGFLRTIISCFFFPYPVRRWVKSLVSKVNLASALSWGSWATSSNLDFVWFCTPETVVQKCLNIGWHSYFKWCLGKRHDCVSGHSKNEQTSRHGRLNRHAIPNRFMYYIHLRYITYIYIFANMYYIYIYENLYSIYIYIYSHISMLIDVNFNKSKARLNMILSRFFCSARSGWQAIIQQESGILEARAGGPRCQGWFVLLGMKWDGFGFWSLNWFFEAALKLSMWIYMNLMSTSRICVPTIRKLFESYRMDQIQITLW